MFLLIGIILALLIGVSLLVWYNCYCYKRIYRLNKNLQKILWQIIKKRSKNLSWPMDKNLLRKADRMMQVERKIIFKRFLAKSVIELFEESRLNYETIYKIV